VYWPPDFETEAALSRLKCTREALGANKLQVARLRPHGFDVMEAC